MFNLGLPEIIIIGAAALLVFGPKRLPELAKSLGKGIRDFKKALEGGSQEEENQLPPSNKPENSIPSKPKSKVAAGSDDENTGEHS